MTRTNDGHAAGGLSLAPDAAEMPLRKRPAALPESLPPRGLSRTQAAAYVGVSPSTFDRMVTDGIMPKPKRIYGRTVWDVKALNAAFDALDSDGDTESPWERQRA